MSRPLWTYCEKCGKRIEIGDTYYDVGEEAYCTDCCKSSKAVGNMTYKEHYLLLQSPEEIMREANADLALACLLYPEKMDIIRQHAEEALYEKFRMKVGENNA